LNRTYDEKTEEYPKVICISINLALIAKDTAITFQ